MGRALCRQCKKPADTSIYIEQDVHKKDGTIGKNKLFFCCQSHLELYKKTVIKRQEELKSLKDYINNLYISNYYKSNFELLSTQIENYMDTHEDARYSGIEYTLKYMVGTLEMNLFQDGYNGTILNLVPYYYNEARDFCIKCAEIKKLASEFDFDDKVRVVKVGNREKKVEEMEF